MKWFVALLCLVWFTGCTGARRVFVGENKSYELIEKTVPSFGTANYYTFKNVSVDQIFKDKIKDLPEGQITVWGESGNIGHLIRPNDTLDVVVVRVENKGPARSFRSRFKGADYCTRGIGPKWNPTSTNVYKKHFGHPMTSIPSSNPYRSYRNKLK
jgi:hypothetical protein